MVSATVSMAENLPIDALQNMVLESKADSNKEVHVGSKKLLFSSSLVVIVLLLTAIPGFTQVQPAQSRVPQQVVINGQRVTAVHVLAASGGFQAYTCLNPQQYGTVDGSSQGWACYEQSTGVWLLNALPPAQAQQPQAQPDVQTSQPQ